MRRRVVVAAVAAAALVGLTAQNGFLQRAWWLSLPDDSRGIGPNAPWRNGGIVQWTDENNPAFSIQSPEGRRLTFRLLAEALPTSPDGLAPGEPWLSGDSIALVPQT